MFDAVDEPPTREDIGAARWIARNTLMNGVVAC